MISKRFLTVLSIAVPAFAAAPIGIVTATGNFTIEKSIVWGNSTLFDGSTVETQQASSDLALRNGVKLQLGAASRARVWADHLALDRGVSQASSTSAFEVDAAGLKIRAAEGPARFRVALNDRVEIVSLAGVARVTNSSGAVLASIPAGRSISFALQQGAASGTITRSGCLLYKDGHYILQDENTQEVVEVNGVGATAQSALRANAGNRVEAVGAAGATRPAVTIATSLLNVSAITAKSQGGCLSAAAALNAQTEAPASGTASTAPAASGTNPPPAVSTGGGGGGMSTGAKIAIIAAIAGGGAGAAIALSGHKSSTSQ